MTPSPVHRSLSTGFLESCNRFPDRVALTVGGCSYTYAELHDMAAAIAATLQHNGGDQGVVGVYGRRHRTAYAGIVGATLLGHGYVSLNPKHPADRVAMMLEMSGARSVIVDEEGEKTVEQLVSKTKRVWVLPDRDDVSDLAQRWPEQIWIGRREMAVADAWKREDAPSSEIAYLIFTSGSTGSPKGVMVEQGNVTAFIDGMVGSVGYDERDRFSQFPELSFDGCVHDLWLAWEVGGAVCVASDFDLLKPHEYVNRERLTIWTFIPSMAGLMHRLGFLKEGVFPTLRASTFAGEALSGFIVDAWRKAAPNSFIENHYGPTEATVTSMRYRVPEVPVRAFEGNVPIGHPVPGMQALVLGPDLQEVEPGESGELWLSGPQITRGYLDDDDRTNRVFCIPPGRDQRHYRTGDLVVRPRGDDPFVFMGRVDQQVQIRGHRVELLEIEHVLCSHDSVTKAAAIGWPEVATGSFDGVVAFLEGSLDKQAVDRIRTHVSEHLPDYMCPRRIHVIDELPINTNGKTDRAALQSLLRDE